MVITRAEAKSKGLKFYYTGNPCVRGHLSERYVRGQCVSCGPELERRRDRARKLATNAAWKKNHPDKVNAVNRAWREAHPEKDSGHHRKWKTANRGKVNASTRKRQAAQIQRSPGWADYNRIRIVYECAAQMSRETGVPMHVDHVIPLQGKRVSGLHVHDNLRIIPARDNARKHNHFEVA